MVHLLFCRALGTIENIPANGGDNFVYSDGIFLNKKGDEIISAIPGMVTDLVVPEGITGIHDYALAGCTGLNVLFTHLYRKFR